MRDERGADEGAGRSFPARVGPRCSYRRIIDVNAHGCGYDGDADDGEWRTSSSGDERGHGGRSRSDCEVGRFRALDVGHDGPSVAVRVDFFGLHG